MNAYETREQETVESANITEHVETETAQRAPYVRCEECGRELLVSLGGVENLPHATGCSLRGVR